MADLIMYCFFAIWFYTVKLIIGYKMANRSSMASKFLDIELKFSKYRNLEILHGICHVSYIVFLYMSVFSLMKLF